jgi:hypothetical protein
VSWSPNEVLPQEVASTEELHEEYVSPDNLLASKFCNNSIIAAQGFLRGGLAGTTGFTIDL